MSKHSAVPASADGVDAHRSPVRPTPGHRAEDVQPAGYRTVGHIDLEGGHRVHVIDAVDLHEAGEAFGSLRLLVDLMADGANKAIAETASGLAALWQQRMRVLAAGTLAVALVAALGVLSVGFSPAASAAVSVPATEGPQPDPVASTLVYRVTLDRPVVALAVPMVTLRPVAGTSQFCASLWIGGSPVGYRCSTTRAFTVTAWLDAAALPVGRVPLELVDEGTGATLTATLEVRRPSAFKTGRWIRMPQGQLYVSAPLTMYSPAAGRWLPQPSAPVLVQERIGTRWVTRATLTTNRAGIAAGVVYLGCGRHVVRVVRPEGRTVTATIGTSRTFVLAPEVPVDTV